jgi:hypothetical protein
MCQACENLELQTVALVSRSFRSRFKSLPLARVERDRKRSCDAREAIDLTTANQHRFIDTQGAARENLHT